MTTKLQLNINASSLRYSHCLLSWFRTIHEGWVEPRFTDKIVYGLAIHKYIDVFSKTGDLSAALKSGLEVFRQPKSLTPKQEFYADEKHFSYTAFEVVHSFPFTDSSFSLLAKHDGSPATEVTFSIPFYEDAILQVNLVGTIDRIGKIRNGVFCIRDWKTTGFWDVDTYLKGYRMSSQLRFYVLSLLLMHRHFPDSVLGQIGANPVGAMIDGIFLKEKPAELKIKSSEVFMFHSHLPDFESSLTRRITQLSRAIESGDVHLKEGIMNNTCELKYNKCSFYPVCAAHNADIEKTLLERNFVQRPYDPLNRDKE